MEFRVAALETGKGTEEQWKQLYFRLSESRRRKADRVYGPEQRRQSLAAGALLEYLLKKGKTKGPFFYGTTERGRPFLCSSQGESREKEGLYFSLSHTKGLAVCAVAPFPVGIDAEYVRKGREKIAKRFFHAEEQEYILSSQNPEECFFSLWTQKEAWAKLTDQPLADVLARNFLDKECTENFSCTCRRGDCLITVCAKSPVSLEKMDAVRLETVLNDLS